MKLSKGLSTLLNLLNIISLFQTGINQQLISDYFTLFR